MNIYFQVVIKYTNNRFGRFDIFRVLIKKIQFSSVSANTRSNTYPAGK